MLSADLLTVLLMVTLASPEPTLRESSLKLKRLFPAKAVECKAVVAVAMATIVRLPNNRGKKT